MALISYLLLLTFLAIGSLADSESLGLFKGQLIKLIDSQDLEFPLQNQQSADSLFQLPSPCELRNQQKEQSGEEEYQPLQLNLKLEIELPRKKRKPQTRPQYDLDFSLPTDISAQSQPKPTIWIIRDPPSQSPLFLVPQYQNRVPCSSAQLPIYQQNLEPLSLGEDRVVQSLYTLSQLESQLQSVTAQIHDLQSASETFSNLNLGSFSQLREDLPVYNLAQLRDDKSQSQTQNQTVNSLEQSNNNLSQSGSQSQSQNQTVINLGGSYNSQSQTQAQNQTINNLYQSINILSGSQSQSQNQAEKNNSDNSQGSQSQSQNQNINSLNQSGLQSENQNVESSQSQSQSQNQTVESSDQIQGSQSQSQNQTVQVSDQSKGPQTQSQSQNQTVNSTGQLQGSQSQTQSQNQTLQGSGEFQASQSQTQSQNLTVNNLDQSGSQNQSQNQTIESSAQPDDSLPQLKLENQSTTISPINNNINKDSIQYIVDNPFITPSDIEDDAKLQTFALIEKYGYPSETHYVHTDDGYKLGMHRIPRPGAQPVILVHGLMSSSASWVQFGPKNGLAYILYRKGYDVWMLNTRGNIYSREHHNKNLSEREYWDFSFHEIGKFDLPSAIDLILQITHQSKVQYIGHSQGSTVFFVMCSEKPEYSSKVNLMQALAPTVFLQDNRSPVLKFLGMFKGKFSMLVNLLGGYEISTKTRLIKQFREHICTRSELASRICAIFDFVLCGFDWKNFNESLTPIVAAHASQGASAKQIYHYAQMNGKLNFQSFDHGRVLNRLRYNDIEPPSYNISLTVTKVVIHHSGGDWLGVNSDVGHLENMLPNLVESRKVQEEGFAHFDFTISKDVRTLVYDSVLGHLENHRFARQ